MSDNLFNARFGVYFTLEGFMWCHLYIDDPSVAFVTSTQMMKEHFELLAASGNMDCAIFSRIDNETGGMHYYFTPAAVSIASAHGADQCEKPLRRDIGSLLCGDQTVIGRLYIDSN